MKHGIHGFGLSGRQNRIRNGKKMRPKACPMQRRIKEADDVRSGGTCGSGMHQKVLQT
jgi:hypothetical protein